MATRQRILSIDVFRGLTVAFMILVNNPGVWGKAYAPLQHAHWNGLTPTDMVYPFFVFIMGISAFFSLSRRSVENVRATAIHVMKRGVLVFAVGCLLQLISQLAYGTLSSWETFRIMGVLQGLAVAYLAGSLIMMAFRFRYMLAAAGILLVLYWVLLLAGNGFDLSADNIIAIVDRAIIGESHMYMERLADGARIAFEPESILTSIPRTAQFLIGAYVGSLIQDTGDSDHRLERILLLGAVMTVSGFLIQYGCPLNKKVWSTSYALVTSGFASLVLGILFWAIDIRGKRRWTGFFRSFGVNPLFLYAFAWCMSVAVNMKMGTDGNTFSVKSWFYGNCIDPFFGDAFGSLLYSLVFIFIVWLVAWVLDRKHIYIKL